MFLNAWKQNKMSHHLKHIWSFIKVDWRKKDFIGKGRRKTPGVSQHLELLISLPEKETCFKVTNASWNKSSACPSCCYLLPAHSTLSLWLQCCKHDDHWVVSRGSLDKTTKLISIHFDDWSFGGPLHHLRHLLWQQSLHTHKDTNTTAKAPVAKTNVFLLSMHFIFVQLNAPFRR